MTLLRRIGWPGLPARRPDIKIRTYPHGREVNPLALRPEDVHVDDTAHALARIGRFNGHTRFFYSVAQHAVLASRHVLSNPWDVAPSFRGTLARYAALHHDDGEAYLGDMPTPLKRSSRLQAYRDASDAAQRACYAAQGLDEATLRAVWVPPSCNVAELVATIDRQLLRIEQVHLTNTPMEVITASLAADGALAEGWHERFRDVLIEPWTPEEAEARYLRAHRDLLGTLRRFQPETFRHVPHGHLAAEGVAAVPDYSKGFPA